jgi:putative ABC transport system permease protein
LGDLREFGRRLLNAGRGRDMESGLDEEIRFHIDRQTEKNLKLGMSPSEARRQALVKFGGVERAKENTRDEFRPRVLEDFSRDLRYGVRTLMRAPGFALVSILTLGLGIGAAAAVFSVVHGVLLKPLSFPAPDRVVRVYQVNTYDGQTNQANFAEPNFVDVKAQNRSFSAMAELGGTSKASVTGEFEPNRAAVTPVSREFFDVVQVRPALGRGFAADDQREGATPTAIVSDAYWRRFLGARLDLRNLTLRSGAAVFQVVGVMPPGFDYPQATEIWIPRELEPPQIHRTGHNFSVIARLRDGVTAEQSIADLNRIARGLKQQYGDDTWMTGAIAIPLLEQLTQNARKPLFILLGAAAFLLVIACANVSNLQLVRAGSRRRELSVRLALGAGRWRVTRQLLAESIVLCVSGGLLGILFAYWGVRALLALQPVTVPRLDQVGINWVVVGVAFAISLVAAIALGLATTMRATGRDLRSTMTDGQRTMSGSRTQQRIRDALVVTQVALTLILLTGAGLLTRSFMQVLAVNPGYHTDNGFIIDLAFPDSDDPAAPVRYIRLQDEIMQRLAQVPGVAAVGGVNDFPLGGGWFPNGTFVEMTRPDELKSYDDFRKIRDDKSRLGTANYRVASEGYFRAMGIPLVKGRTFEATDAPDGQHVAVISESLAKTKWPNQDPIGKYIQFGNMDGDLRAFRIVGIVGEVREINVEVPPSPTFYGFYKQRVNAAGRFNIVAHGTDRPEAIATAQRIVRELDPELPVVVRTVSDAFGQSVSGRRFNLILIGVFSIAALVLATMGLYGVISYLVAQRTREIGIRLALGATSTDLGRMVLGHGAMLALVGTVVGLAGAFWLKSIISGLLFGVGMLDPVAIAGVIGLIGAAALTASYLPARRAMRVAPVITLRSE